MESVLSNLFLRRTQFCEPAAEVLAARKRTQFCESRIGWLCSAAYPFLRRMPATACTRWARISELLSVYVEAGAHLSRTPSTSGTRRAHPFLRNPCSYRRWRFGHVYGTSPACIRVAYPFLRRKRAKLRTRFCARIAEPKTYTSHLAKRTRFCGDNRFAKVLGGISS